MKTVLSLITVFPLVAAAQVGTEFLVSSDSEGFEVHKVSAEYFPTAVGVRATAYQYGNDSFTKTGKRITAVGRAGDYVNGWSFDVGAAQQSRHQQLVGEGNYRKTFGNTGVEVFATRDWIETERALNAGITHTFVGTAVDQPIGEHFTVVGVAGYQMFTDGNRRNHWRARGIYQPWTDLGLTLQYRYRAYQSTDMRALYFNPKDYHENALAVAYRKRIAGWTAAATLGFGREVINDVGQATHLLEFSVQSPAKGPYVQFRAGFNRSAGVGGPDYLYRYAAGEIVVPLK